MNHERRRHLLALAWFPLLYLGLALLDAYISIYVLDRYERKHGPWNSFKITMLLQFFFALATSVSYAIGLIRRLETVMTQSSFWQFVTALVSVCIVQVSLRFADQVAIAGLGYMLIPMLCLFALPMALAFLFFSTILKDPVTNP